MSQSTNVFRRVRRALTMPSSTSHNGPTPTFSSSSSHKSTNSSSTSSSTNLSTATTLTTLPSATTTPSDSPRNSLSLSLSLTKITSLKIKSALPTVLRGKEEKKRRKIEEWARADEWEWEHPSEEVLEKRSRKWSRECREGLRGWNGFVECGEGDERSVYEGISPCTTRIPQPTTSDE